jgi:hypothetical protein
MFTLYGQYDNAIVRQWAHKKAEEAQQTLDKNDK